MLPLQCSFAKGKMKDAEILDELVDALQDAPFHQIVLREIEKRKGRPLTEQERRKFLAELRNNVQVTRSRSDA